jgi:hypothetical protein
MVPKNTKQVDGKILKRPFLALVRPATRPLAFTPGVLPLSTWKGHGIVNPILGGRDKPGLEPYALRETFKDAV